MEPLSVVVAAKGGATVRVAWVGGAAGGWLSRRRRRAARGKKWGEDAEERPSEAARVGDFAAFCAALVGCDDELLSYYADAAFARARRWYQSLFAKTILMPELEAGASSAASCLPNARSSSERTSRAPLHLVAVPRRC